MNKTVIGLTGTTGAGKSTISLEFAKNGFNVIDCDKVAKFVVENDNCIINKLCNSFGNDIINKDGLLDRRLLASRAFADEESTKTLNTITLPAIVKCIAEQIDNCDESLILLDAPTLFESGANKLCNATIGIICDDKTRKERIMIRDNLTENQAYIRMSAQKSNDFFKENCTYIIENDSTVADLIEKAQSVIDKILKG